MNAREIFDAWAPAGLPWSDWAKPALFLNLPNTPAATLEGVLKSVPLDGVPPADQFTAIVVDLPGGESVLTGMALTGLGYRPVPLFNCNSAIFGEVVDTSAIRHCLDHGANDLMAMRLTPTAPPAFLLDIQRLRGRKVPVAGDFDNRWTVLPQDFPSGNLLRSHGITQVVLLQAEGDRPQDDLAHVLRRWQESGLQILLHNPRLPGSSPQAIVVARPPSYRSVFHHLLVVAGLRRHSAGGFGSAIPMPSTSSGYG